MTAVPEHNPERGREDRAEAMAASRRRRRAGNLNRMASFKLDIFEPEQLDLENFVYRWVNDEDGRMRMATHMDDYDHVSASEIKQFDANSTDSESSERIRMLTGRDKNGNPIYSYLLKKPRAYFEEDQERSVQFREDMMNGIVHNADVGSLEGKASDLAGNAYVPKTTVSVGSAAQRRRGPLPRKK
jgi:hypothetical protein